MSTSSAGELSSFIHLDTSLLEDHPLPTWIIDGGSHKLLFANRAAEIFTGFSSGFEFQNFCEFLAEESRVRLFHHTAARLKNFRLTLKFSFPGREVIAELHAASTHHGARYQLCAVDLKHNAQQDELLRYRSFIEQTSEGIFCQEMRKPVPINLPFAELLQETEKQSFIVECNDALSKMYGYENACQLLGARTVDLIDYNHPSNLQFFKSFIENGFRIVNAESYERDRFGKMHYFLNNAIGIIENGYLKRVWGTQREITREKKTSEERKLFARLVEETSDVLTAADLEFRPLTWNRAAEKLYGIRAEEVIGKDVSSLLSINYYNTTRDEVRDIIREEGEWRGEAWFIRPSDQKMVTIIIRFKQLKNESQEHIGFIITAIDITERMEAESRLRESESRFREMADSSPAMIWMSDENNNITYINREWIRFTGEMPGFGEDRWMKQVHPDDVKKIALEYHQAFEERKPVTLVYRLLRHDGNYRWVHDVSSPRFLNDGRFIGFIGSVVDIEEQKQKQLQLAYQANILENVSDIIVTTDLHLVVKVWNNTAEHYYEVCEKDAIGKNITSLVKYNFPSSSMEIALEEIKQHGIWQGEVSIVNKKGETKYFLHTVKFVVDERGNRIGYLSVGRDITELKLAAEKVKKSENFYRTLIADSLDGMILLNKDGNITFASPSVKNVLGYDVEELLGKNSFSYVHPEDLSWALQSFEKEVVEDPEVKFIVVRLLKKSGDWVWCMVRGHNMMSNPSINSIVIYFHDDTLRKNASEELKESEKRFRTLISDLHTGVLLQDGEGNILMTNHAASTVFGYDEHHMAGKKIWEVCGETIREDGSFIPVEEKPAYLAIKTKKLVKDVVLGVIHPKTKERVWMIVCANPILNAEGNLRYLVLSITDITARKKLENKLLTDKVAHQRQLVQASIEGQENERLEIGKELHDNIGQQLTTIKLFLDLAKTTSDETTLEMLSMALKGVSDAINDVRAMSRSLVPSTLKDLGLIESIDELVESIIRTQLLSIDFEFDSFQEKLVPEKQKLTLFRIVQEQLNNIVKHAEASRVSISVQSCKKKVLLEIIDNGKGFDPDKIRKGVGFMNMKNRAELFSGKVEICSKPGKGCRLTVTIPFEQC